MLPAWQRMEALWRGLYETKWLTAIQGNQGDAFRLITTSWTGFWKCWCLVPAFLRAYNTPLNAHNKKIFRFDSSTNADCTIGQPMLVELNNKNLRRKLKVTRCLNMVLVCLNHNSIGSAGHYRCHHRCTCYRSWCKLLMFTDVLASYTPFYCWQDTFHQPRYIMRLIVALQFQRRVD
jgi:hypothetical protein